MTTSGSTSSYFYASDTDGWTNHSESSDTDGQGYSYSDSDSPTSDSLSSDTDGQSSYFSYSDEYDVTDEPTYSSASDMDTSYQSANADPSTMEGLKSYSNDSSGNEDSTDWIQRTLTYKSCHGSGDTGHTRYRSSDSYAQKRRRVKYLGSRTAHDISREDYIDTSEFTDLCRKRSFSRTPFVSSSASESYAPASGSYMNDYSTFGTYSTASGRGEKRKTFYRELYSTSSAYYTDEDYSTSQYSNRGEKLNFRDRESHGLTSSYYTDGYYPFSRHSSYYTDDYSAFSRYSSDSDRWEKRRNPTNDRDRYGQHSRADRLTTIIEGKSLSGRSTSSYTPSWMLDRSYDESSWKSRGHSKSYRGETDSKRSHSWGNIDHSQDHSRWYDGRGFRRGRNGSRAKLDSLSLETYHNSPSTSKYSSYDSQKSYDPEYCDSDTFGHSLSLSYDTSDGDRYTSATVFKRRRRFR